MSPRRRSRRCPSPKKRWYRCFIGSGSSCVCSFRHLHGTGDRERLFANNSSCPGNSTKVLPLNFYLKLLCDNWDTSTTVYVDVVNGWWWKNGQEKPSEAEKDRKTLERNNWTSFPFPTMIFLVTNPQPMAHQSPGNRCLQVIATLMLIKY